MAAPEIPGLTFVALLGSGGFADVYLYEQFTPARRVAVKVLRFESLSADTLDRFRAEVNAMAQLEHPHIVPIYWVGETSAGHPYFAMTYYPRGNLAERAKRRTLDVAETIAVGVQLSGALETAHRAGILHRDVKPANVLVSQFGMIGLADFGIAARLAGAEDSSFSVPWSAPEVLDGTSLGSIASDVYGLAATLWHLLVGRSPFVVPGGDNAADALTARVLSLPPPSTDLDEVPIGLDRLLRQGMAKDPDERPKTILEFARALQSVQRASRLSRTELVLAADDATSLVRTKMAHLADAKQDPPRATPTVGPTAPPTPVPAFERPNVGAPAPGQPRSAAVRSDSWAEEVGSGAGWSPVSSSEPRQAIPLEPTVLRAGATAAPSAPASEQVPRTRADQAADRRRAWSGIDPEAEDAPRPAATPEPWPGSSRKQPDKSNRAGTTSRQPAQGERRGLRARLPSRPVLLSVLAVVLGIVVVVALVGQPRNVPRDSAGHVTEVTQVRPGDVLAGDCTGSFEDLSKTVDQVTLIPCTQRHSWELFATIDLAKSSYSSDADLGQAGIGYCTTQFASFVGRTLGVSIYYQVVFLVASEAWDLSTRVQCYAGHSGGGITKSLKNVRK